MTGPHPKHDEDALTDPITLTVEIDPAAFDEPRQVMWERLIEAYGQGTIADLVKTNLSQDLTAQGCILSTPCGTTATRFRLSQGRDNYPISPRYPTRDTDGLPGRDGACRAPPARGTCLSERRVFTCAYCFDIGSRVHRNQSKASLR
jgi:hypothetical protein